MGEYVWRFGKVLVERGNSRPCSFRLVRWLLGEDLQGFSQRFLPYLTSLSQARNSPTSTDISQITALLSANQSEMIVPVADVETAPSQTRESALSPFPHRRIQSDIARIQRSRLERIANLQLWSEQEAFLTEKRAKKARKVLEMRKIGLGIERGVEEEVSLFDFESVQCVEDAKIPLVIPNEEITDLKPLFILQKRYKRFFNALFSRFSGSGFAPKTSEVSDFDYLAARKAKLTISELIKALSHLSLLPNLLSLEEFRQLLKAFCGQIGGKEEIGAVAVGEFRGLMEQMAWAVADRLEVGRWGLVVQFKAFMEYIQLHLLDQTLTPYFSPNPGICDLAVFNRLNALLASDPCTPLLPGFKKASVEDISIVYAVPQELNIGQNWAFAIELLEDVLFKAVGVHYLEARTVVTTRIYAKGAGTKGEGAGLGEELRWRVWEMGGSDRETAWECAKVLEKVLRAVSLGVKGENRSKRSISQPHPAPPKSLPLSNRIPESQTRLFLRIKAVEDKKRAEIAEKQAKANLELEEIKKKQRKYEQEREIRGSALQSWLENKAKRAESAQTDRVVGNLGRKEDYRKLQSRLETLIRAKQEHWKALRQAETTVSTHEMETRAVQRRKIAKQLEINRDLVGKKQEKAEELKNFAESQPVKSLFSGYFQQISFLFAFFCKRSDRPLDFSPSEMPLSAYIRLCLTLDIVPTLLSQDQNTLIFKSITHKKASIQGKSAIMDLEEFQFALIHIANIGRETLNAKIGRPGGQLDLETVKGLIGLVRAERNISDLKDFLRVRTEMPRGKSHIRYSSAVKAVSYHSNRQSTLPNSEEYREERGIAPVKAAFRSSKTALQGGHRAASSFDSGVTSRRERRTESPYL